MHPRRNPDDERGEEQCGANDPERPPNSREPQAERICSRLRSQCGNDNPAEGRDADQLLREWAAPQGDQDQREDDRHFEQISCEELVFALG